MEDILVALIQAVGEILGALCEVDEIAKLFLKGIFYVIQEINTDWPTMSDDDRAGCIGVLYLILGLVAGMTSVHFWHDTFFRKSVTRMLLVVVAPVLNGILSWIVAHLRTVLGQILVPRYYFWWALFFSFGFCLIRFGYCHRPEM